MIVLVKPLPGSFLHCTSKYLFSLDTELFHICCPDHADPMVCPSLSHSPNLVPGQGGRVKLQYGGKVVTIVATIVATVASCLQLTT